MLYISGKRQDTSTLTSYPKKTFKHTYQTYPRSQVTNTTGYCSLLPHIAPREELQLISARFARVWFAKNCRAPGEGNFLCLLQIIGELSGHAEVGDFDNSRRASGDGV